MSVILRVGAVKPSGGQETHNGSGDEASSSYTDADVLDIPLPEHTYQRPLPPTSTHAHSSIGYFGLPYQDHNYGMPPPPSPPRPASPRPPSPLQVNGVVQMEEEVKTTPLVSVVEEVVEDSITRCICGYLHDDGYMICCDKCSVWQHIDCMGVDRNNIPESYFCELCQPRILDAVKAKMMQKRKREELAARNVLSDSSATDTDPEEAANALASMGRKLPASKKKGLKQKRNSKLKDKPPLKLKIGKALAQKRAKKPGKKEKENIKATKPKKMFRLGSQKVKSGKTKNRPLLTLEQLSADPWNSNLSPWVDSYEHAHENQYSPAVREFSSNSHLINQSVDISSIISDQLLAQLTCVADVKKNRKGLKATQEIPAGQAIIEYKGKVMLRHDYDKEHAFINSFKKLQPFVLFYSKLDVDLCVDARTYGNEARFIRRSCSPNSEVQHIFSQGQMYFIVFSKKPIQADSEITIPFDYNYEDCSYCVECACNKNNCIVTRYWKKLKNAQKSSNKEFTVKRKRQSSGGDGGKNFLDDGFISGSSHESPVKATSSPVKSLQMTLTGAVSPPKLNSPIKSSVSTLLAASALLDGQPDLASSLKLEVPESLPQAPPPPAPPPPPPKSATSSRRGSRVSEDSVKEEKPSFTHTKEKNKIRESKQKEKESKDHHYHHSEVKKERRPSSRRQSQEDPDEVVNHKGDVTVSAGPPGTDTEDSNSVSECPRKMTREERKLDAIMKAFEKMEKREERRKEAMARGDGGTKKGPGESKTKKDDTDGNSSCGSSIQSRTTSQDGPAEGGESIKVEPTSDDQQEMKSPGAGTLVSTVDTKAESSSGGTPPSGSGPSVVPAVTQETIRPVKEESPQKPVRKSGKRKRRKSRVQSTTALSDAASVSTDDGNSNSSFPTGPLSVPATPVPTPASTPVPPADLDGGMFKYLKTKKHLFEEWSNKQDDENSKQEEEMFVQCLPNPHVNTMDHLQRRNSHSAGCNMKGSESSVGSAKKRWLRQAMHEDPTPAPVAFNHSLSVSTDSGGGSPVHGGASPNPGAGLGSPGAASPLDFVTPLKKRRLMRESLSNESNGPTASAGLGVLAENFTSNNIGGGITPKTNGVRQLIPAHRHSTDDRWLLHKGYPHQNGFREIVTLADGVRSNAAAAAASHSHLTIPSTHHEINGLELRGTVPEQRAESALVPGSDAVPVPVSIPRVNGISEAVPVNSVSFTQPTGKYPLKFRGIFERMEVDSSEEILKQKEIQPIASSSRMEENGIRVSRPPFSRLEEDNEIDSSASTSTVVVVNSSVYNGVSNLIDEGSEAGCVTAKTIMDVDSPAIVRIDLNAHEMEPSSLSDCSAVVNLDDQLFNRCTRDKRSFETPSECQVNSSEDVVETLPLVTEGRNSDICDNVCTDSSSAQVVIGHREQDGGQIIENSGVVEEEGEVVDSSQHVNRNSVSEVAEVFEEEDTNFAAVQDLPGTSSSYKPDTECISSSGQTATNEVETEEPSVVCDSAEAASDSVSELDETSRSCDTGSVSVEVSLAQRQDIDEGSVDGEEVRTCDSVGGNVESAQLSTSRLTAGGSDPEEVGDSAVSESRCSDQPFFFTNAGDSNVDSTSSESGHRVSQQSSEERARDVVAQNDCCDSNYERQPSSNAACENPVTGDESSSEGLGVSSSNVTDSHSASASWESYDNVKRQYVEDGDNAVSTVTNEYNSGISQSTSPRAEVSSEPLSLQEDASSEGGPSSSAVISISTPSTASSSVTNSMVPSTSQPLTSSPTSVSSSLSSSSSTVAVVETAPSSTSFGTPGPSLTTTTTSSVVAVPVTSSPPISSTAEATPAVKKKVSLLEYRKRLKEKPASSTAETSKTSTTVAASSSSSPLSSTTHHHKLSSTLSLFLASSSPTSSSSSSTSPSKSSSHSHSLSHKKQMMPTLATLPLFKSADHKNRKEEEKKKHKPKPEKQLSLTDRLRLEFGLDDCGDDASKKKKGEESEVASSNGAVDDHVPPPPPPTVGSSYPVPAAAPGFVASSTHPRAGFHGSQAPLVNGGPGSYYNYQQQQPNISSTSLSTPPPAQHGMGGRERQTSAISGQTGPSGAVPGRSPVGPYPPHHHHQQQQQPSSSSSSLSSTSHFTGPSHPHSWPLNQGPLPSSVAALSSTKPHPVPSPSLQYDFNHRQSSQPSQSQTIVSGNIVPDDHPPPPPPPPPRPHHRSSSTSSSSSSSSSHRHHHHHHSSSGKSKGSKAAASSSSSSSSSSRYPDNRSRY